MGQLQFAKTVFLEQRRILIVETHILSFYEVLLLVLNFLS